MKQSLTSVHRYISRIVYACSVTCKHGRQQLSRRITSENNCKTIHHSLKCLLHESDVDAHFVLKITQAWMATVCNKTRSRRRNISSQCCVIPLLNANIIEFSFEHELDVMKSCNGKWLHTITLYLAPHFFFIW